MGKFVKVASTQEIEPGMGSTVTADGEEIALFNVNGTFHAVHNTCVHRGGPLGEGSLEGQVVTCPWHGWQYDVTTGVSTVNPSAKVKKFNVKVEGTDVLVEVG
ncbi:MAG: Rieske 2Fe-2S domain-containing protein [Elusimicrobia bacterium]|nr:Rieske 2Fe-2S domain-containing protein [Elusimicrobiota bacterium]